MVSIQVYALSTAAQMPLGLTLQTDFLLDVKPSACEPVTRKECTLSPRTPPAPRVHRSSLGQLLLHQPPSCEYLHAAISNVKENPA